MPTYVIFNKKNGKIVHTHVEPEEVKTSKENILSLVDSSYDRSSLEVTLVDTEGLSFGDSYQVDIRSGKLKPVKKDKISGFGIGAAQLYNSDATTLPVKTIYQRNNQGKQRDK